MKFLDAVNYLAERRTTELVVTSAGNSAQAWWAATHDSHGTFYLEASMSLSTMFASGLALAQPGAKVWAFMGDGAFCMNPGMLMVERDMNLPNLTHFLMSNRHYGATSNADLPNMAKNDYAAIARGMGLERVYNFASLDALRDGFDEAVLRNDAGHSFVVLEVDPFTDAEQKLPQPPLDGAELKYRFGRHVEATCGADIFGYKL